MNGPLTRAVVLGYRLAALIVHEVRPEPRCPALPPGALAPDGIPRREQGRRAARELYRLVVGVVGDRQAVLLS